MSALPPPTTETDSATHARALSCHKRSKQDVISSDITIHEAKPFFIRSSSMPTRVQDCQLSAPAVELSDPSTSTVVASASMEMEQLTARFNDAVAVHGNN
uniref:Uncharacterized protein n=1 Tax=Oryza barthii TaxID=65489 RepID=A0A0D3FQD0_9ORYZ